MLTAVVVGSDRGSTSALRAALQETGLVYSVHEWDLLTESHPLPGEAIPDVVWLDLPRDPGIFFAFAARLRHLRPGVHIIACSAAPEPTLLMQAMRSGVQEFIPKPISAETVRDALERFVEVKGDGGKEPDKLIVVVGSKGGVGTSTVAVNLGVQLTQITKKRVLLVDFGRPLGHVSLLLDLQPRFTLRDAVENLERLDQHFLSGLVTRHHTGLEILAGTSHPEEWQKISLAALGGVVNIAQGGFDYVLVDAGVVDPSEWSPILRTARSILMVAEPTLLSLWTLERHLSTMDGAGLSPSSTHIVINRWRRNDDNALRNVEERLHRPIAARLPNDYRQVSESVTQGMPLTGSNSNPLVVCYRQLASELIKEPAESDERRQPSASRFVPVR
jgi:pilus assembly protein CpaE